MLSDFYLKENGSHPSIHLIYKAESLKAYLLWVLYHLYSENFCYKPELIGTVSEGIVFEEQVNVEGVVKHVDSAYLENPWKLNEKNCFAGRAVTLIYVLFEHLKEQRVQWSC